MVRWGGGGRNETPWKPIRRGCPPLGPQSSCTGGREKFLRAPSGFCGKRARNIRWVGQGCGRYGRQLISLLEQHHPDGGGAGGWMHVLFGGASHRSFLGPRHGSITRSGASWGSDILIRSTLPSCMHRPRMAPPPISSCGSDEASVPQKSDGQDRHWSEEFDTARQVILPSSFAPHARVRPLRRAG